MAAACGRCGVRPRPAVAAAASAREAGRERSEVVPPLRGGVREARSVCGLCVVCPPLRGGVVGVVSGGVRGGFVPRCARRVRHGVSSSVVVVSRHLRWRRALIGVGALSSRRRGRRMAESAHPSETGVPVPATLRRSPRHRHGSVAGNRSARTVPCGTGQRRSVTARMRGAADTTRNGRHASVGN